ncbi:MAG: hypothetical protein DRM98_05275 [Thermoplasmata archaeon]|nr:MAG: hypothetical protein DRM98_05275 [Thermoplasmata archaeon]
MEDAPDIVKELNEEFGSKSFLHHEKYSSLEPIENKPLQPKGTQLKKAFVFIIIVISILGILFFVSTFIKNNSNFTFLCAVTDDAQITQNAPNSNSGSGERMTVRNAYGATYGWARDILIKFDISSIPPSTHISSAKLKLYYYSYYDNNPSGNNLSIYRITSDWNEDTVTWETQPTCASQPTDISIVPSLTNTWMEWDVTSDVQDFINGEKTNYGWKITDETYWGHANIPITYFRTKEYGHCIPYLEVKK